MRYRSVGHVADEFDFVARELPQVNTIMLEDDTFIIDIKRTDQLADELIKRGNKLPFDSNCRADTKADVETYLNAHDYDNNGLKLHEHAYMNNRLVTAFESLLCPEGKYWKSRVVWQGDQRDSSYDLTNPGLLLSKVDDMDAYKYIVNHSKRQYVDKVAVNQENYHPLPLLICEGYTYDEIKVKGELKIGAWARDVISIEKDAPQDFEKKYFNSVESLKSYRDDCFDQDGICDDFDVVLSVVKRNGMELEYASSDLIDNEDIVLAAVEQNGIALQFASDTMRENNEVIDRACTQNPLALEFVLDEETITDRYFLLVLVKENGMVLQFIDGKNFQDSKEKLKIYFEVALAAVKQNGLALQFAGDVKLDIYFEVALAAVKQNGDAIKFVNDNCLTLGQIKQINGAESLTKRKIIDEIIIQPENAKKIKAC
jgi:hypothetical protein